MTNVPDRKFDVADRIRGQVALEGCLNIDFISPVAIGAMLYVWINGIEPYMYMLEVTSTKVLLPSLYLPI